MRVHAIAVPLLQVEPEHGRQESTGDRGNGEILEMLWQLGIGGSRRAGAEEGYW